MNGGRPAPLRKRLAWFAGLWVLGLLSLAFVGWAIGLVLGRP